jgi:hypothetical protein
MSPFVTGMGRKMKKERWLASKREALLKMTNEKA